VFRRDHDHAFVITVGIVIQQHDHAALADITDQFIYCVQTLFPV
jgi:hypothetical protein